MAAIFLWIHFKENALLFNINDYRRKCDDGIPEIFEFCLKNICLTKNFDFCLKLWLILHTPDSEIPDLAYHIHSLLRLLTQLLTLLRHMILQ